MTYEPRGKIAIMMDAMRAQPSRIWTSAEVCKVMDVQQGALTAHLDAAIRHGAIYRKLEGGRCQYGLKPFTASVSTTVARETPTWKAPQMVPPRGTPGSAVEPAATQRGTWDPQAVLAKLDILHPVDPDLDAILQREVQASREPAAAPQAAPALAEASIPEGASAEEEEPQVTWCLWQDGDLDLHGLQEMEDGSHRLPAEALSRLRKFIAWVPA